MTIEFSDEDVERVKKLVGEMQNHPIVIERQDHNVDRNGIDISRQSIWKSLLLCILTTQMKSGNRSRVQIFLDSQSPIISLESCRETENLTELALQEIKVAGIRWAKRKADWISKDLKLLEDEGWELIEMMFSTLAKSPQTKDTERHCATELEKLLFGLGPKQSRHLITTLGLSQHEIPIDSRLIKWLKGIDNPETVPLLSTVALTDPEYYCGVLDAIQSLCVEANVLPCIFDASVFASFEKA
jgi:thermostable 8-oxoguanine DNA glycosylase